MARTQSDIKVMEKHCDKLGLGDKTFKITEEDRKNFVTSLRSSGYEELAKYVEELGSASELEDLIVNTIYG